MRPDELRNLLILAGTERELRHLIDTIDMFDIDWMAGMSVGRVHAAERRRQDGRWQELDKVDRRPQHEPARRHPAHHPDRADERAARGHAAARVPRGGEEVDRAPRPGRRRRRRRASTSTTCRTQRAEKLGPLLQQAFTGRASPAAGAVARRRVAPGTPAGHDRQSRRRSRRSPRSPPTTAVDQRHGRRRGAGQPQAAAARRREGIGIVRNIQVVADKDNNTLLIVATPAEYSVIEEALQQARRAAAAGDDRGDDRRGAR